MGSGRAWSHFSIVEKNVVTGADCEKMRDNGSFKSGGAFPWERGPGHVAVGHHLAGGSVVQPLSDHGGPVPLQKGDGAGRPLR